MFQQDKKTPFDVLQCTDGDRLRNVTTTGDIVVVRVAIASSVRSGDVSFDGRPSTLFSRRCLSRVQLQRSYLPRSSGKA